MSSELNLSYSRVERILKNVLRMRPYWYAPVQALTDRDHESPLEFCQWFISQCEVDSTFVDSVLWTDESYFNTNGRVNRKNNVYWSEENPRVVEEAELNVPGLMLWCGISSRGILGSTFLMKP